MPVLVPLLIGAGASAVAVTAGATVATAAVVGVGAAVISKKTGISDKIYEEIVKPVGNLVEDVVGSDLGNAVLKVAAIATGNTWAVPLIDGAKVAANGGDIGDVLKAAAISYVGQTVGDVTGKYVTSALADTGASDFLIDTVVSGTKSATKAIVYGQDPLKAFAQGGLTAAVSAGLGKVDTKLRETYGETFENLDEKVKQSVFSGLRTELSGGDLTEGQVGDIIAKYTGASNIVNEFLKDNVGLTAEAAEVLTRAVSDGVSVALAGGSGLDAFSGSLSATGAEALKKIIDKPVYKAIDKVTGAYRRTEEAADALTTQSNKAATTANAVNAQVDKANGAVSAYNRLQADLAGKIQTQERLQSTYDAALEKYNGDKTQANADAVTTAINAYNTYATNLESDYNDNYKDQLAGYKNTVDTANAAAAKLKATLDAENAEVTKLQSVYDDTMKWVVTETDNLDAVLKPKITEVNKAVALTLRPNIDEDAYREMHGLEAGADVYAHFLQQGQQLPTDFDGTKQLLASSHGSLIRQVLATEGMDVSSMEPESLRAVAAHVVNNVKNIKDITGIDFDSFAREALTKARDATPKGGVFPTGFSREDGVRDSDIANGVASLGVTSTGDMQWQNTAKVNDRLTGSGSGSYTIEDLERSMAAQVGGVVSVEFVGTPPTLADMINTAMEGDFGALSTSALGTIASLNDEAGRLLDTYLISPTYENAKTVYNYLNEETGGGLGNAGSIAVGAGGEMLQAIAGLSVLAGANPNNALGRAAKNMLSLSGDMKSDEWKAAAEEMQANTANYDAEWRAANPGQEPSMAQKAYLKTAAIFGNIKDHPVQWISENIVSELLQEVPILLASGGTGNVAKRLLLEAGEAQARKVAARVAIGTGVTLDAAEAFGGTAAGAFDEAYGTYKKANPEATEQQATDYAMDVAQKAGSIAVVTLAATMGIGGQALSKSLFGDKGTKSFADSYDVLKSQIKDGTKVTVKEGVTEFVEEALPQLYVGTSLSQIDPTYDVAGSVFEAGVMGKLAGAGVAGGIYTGNAVADALMTTNPAVKEAIVNAGSAENATQVLQDMGISDNEVLNNLLNTTYDAQYITTTEAGEMFVKENPGFTPTESEIAALAGKKGEANLAAEVASYVDPRFLDVDEVKAAAAAEGITLTDEQAQAYVGQKDETSAVQEIAEEYDPQGTTRAEAEQFFADLGYAPTEAEITARMGATPEAEQKTAIEQYVDPRQVTEAEARAFYEDLGYEPTDEEVAARVGQVAETDVKDAIGAYVDPRQTTEEEARQFFADLDYIPSDEEVAARVGQVAETDVKEAIDAYVDPRYTTEEEIRQFFADQGFVPDDRIVERLVGQGGENAEQMKEMLVAGYVDPRQVTEAEARQFFANQGYEPTDEEVAARVGQSLEETFEADTEAGVEPYVDPRQVTEAEARAFYEDLGYEPTDAEIAQFVGQGADNFEDTAPERVETYVDPRQVTTEEAKEFFSDLGYDPTDEQIAQFVAQVEETTQQDVISKYVDPRQVTQAEVQAIADEEGLTLTEALAATYIGQSEAENFQAEQLATARAEYDPLATTLEEATQFFADTGYTATTEEIAGFVASKTEEAQTSAIGAYVDPRQVTAEEAQEFLSAIGYQPTQEEIDQFTGQVNDENFEVAQRTAVDEYVDPRFFDAGEVRAAYEELGLVDVTQEDVDRFVGQFDPESAEYGFEGFESAQMDELRTYMPTATFNVIREVLGSPAVEDDPNTEADESKDATGIYAEFEAGATRDEALQTAIDTLSTDLGLTKEAMLEQLGLTEEALSSEIDAVAADVEAVQEDVVGLGEQITDVETGLGEQITDVETSLTELINKNDGDVDAALEELATTLGTTETNILAELGTTKDLLTEKITDVETGLGEQITDVETSLGADIQTVADLIGKPARDVTQTDVDFVIDLIAQENVAAETIQQYDVTGDGVLDINDQNMLASALQGDQDVTFADTSMFNPATGLYLQQEQDTQATMDAILDMNTQINTNIDTRAKERNINDMMQQIMASGDIAGQQVSVKTPDPMNIDYLYDISGESIFATPSQAQLFSSPYGGTRVDQPRQQPANTQVAPSLLPRRASGFAEGGQVEDETDMLLRILGDT